MSGIERENTTFLPSDDLGWLDERNRRNDDSGGDGSDGGGDGDDNIRATTVPKEGLMVLVKPIERCLIC